ncbi:ABC transporter permease subunit [Fictibacillus nanhaiensis]|uniref:ABC transporter permease subunit n=1 Tax=Fictibacillus nanhaiensis TaxID=742169 RepID=UPI001C97A87B|nr:ABC transporter permease subunit [Fictibacillus nanhaiensis]MBY6038401.1 ABC transporter permease subunit [Fictibacillus nanhaiensis]
MRIMFSIGKQVALLVVCIVLLSSTPSLLAGKSGIALSVTRYVQTVFDVLKGLFRPDLQTLYTHTQHLAFPRIPVNRSVVFLNEITERPLFPEIWDSILYTLSLLLFSFAVAFLAAVLLGWVTELLPSAFKKGIIRATDLLEALPDLFFVFCIQLAVVWIYKKTGWLAANPFTSSKEPSFFLPVIALSLVPAIYLFRMQLVLSQTEIQKDYITFARSKGISRRKIIFHHLLRNTLHELSIHLPFIMLLLFSQLVVIEYLFNMNGVIGILLSDQRPETRAMLLLLIVLPLYGTIKAIELIVRKVRNPYAA